MLKPKRGLTLKTFAFALILMTLVMTVSLGILYVFLPGYYFRHKNNQLTRNADVLQQHLDDNPSMENSMALIANFSEGNNATVVAFDTEDRLLIDFSSPMLVMGAMGHRVSIMAGHANGRPEGYRVSVGIAAENDVAQTALPQGIQLFSTSAHISEASEDGMGVVRVTTGPNALFRQHFANVVLERDIAHPDISRILITSTLQPIDEAQEVIISMIPYLFLAGFVIALGLAFLFARQLTKPILKISDAAAQMREMKPGVVSEVDSGDELGQLSQNLNKLYRDLRANMQDLQSEMERTARLEQSKTDFMRAAGHELKTPIAALSGILDGMIDQVGQYKDHAKYLPECKAQTGRLAKLVNEILIASEHVGDDAYFESVDIRGLIDEAVANVEALIEKKGLRLEIVSDVEFQYPADVRLLSTTMSNLLSNEVKYTPDGGHIVISLAPSPGLSQGGMVFSIENECPAVAPDLLSKWFEPFYTPEYSRNKSKSGTGLGLYIVKKNLEALQLPFEIMVTETGIRFEIVFPIVQT